jgi:hypothetical protein
MNSFEKIKYKMTNGIIEKAFFSVMVIIKNLLPYCVTIDDGGVSPRLHRSASGPLPLAFIPERLSPELLVPIPACCCLRVELGVQLIFSWKFNSWGNGSAA